MHTVDIRVIYDDPSVLFECADAFRENNEKNGVILRTSDNNAVILSPLASGGSNPDTYKVCRGTGLVQVDHVKGEIVSELAEESGESEEEKEVREKLYSAASEYARNHYPTGEVGVYTQAEGAGWGLCISSPRFNAANFWNGSWISSWTIDASGNMSGTVKATVHYYENGNVLLTAGKELQASGAGDPSTWISALMKEETAFHSELNAAFHSLSESVFKGLRRKLPVMGKTLEWENIAGYKLGEELSKK